MPKLPFTDYFLSNTPIFFTPHRPKNWNSVDSEWIVILIFFDSFSFLYFVPELWNALSLWFKTSTWNRSTM